MNDAKRPCPSCGQIDHGQYGEYPCPACGLPLTFDQSASDDLRDAAERISAAIALASQKRHLESGADVALAEHGRDVMARELILARIRALEATLSDDDPEPPEFHDGYARGVVEHPAHVAWRKRRAALDKAGERP